jgi:SAM-dependent methyltransferase
MSDKNINLNDIRNYFDDKLQKFGTTHLGVDYNSPHSQEHRFAQLIKIINPDKPYSLLDFGSGYGSLYGYLSLLGHDLTYYGYDILETMVDEGRNKFRDNPHCIFSASLENIPRVNYAVASGTFNMKMDYGFQEWQDFVLNNIRIMNEHSLHGFSFNLLTSYSDPEYMRRDLYYADPCFYFDYCKKHFSKNIALLHDYGLYDFTILVRKDV